MTSAIVTLADGFTLDQLDLVYGRLAWKSVFSTGTNIPLGIAVPLAVQKGLGIPSFYERGLWLFSSQGGGTRLTGWPETFDGWSCQAYTSKHAKYLFEKEHT